jgi:hypothetical protein
LICFFAGSIITSSITNQRTDLQIALSNFVKRKQLIVELAKFGVTSSYDKFLLFKGSAAYSTMEKNDYNVKSSPDNSKLIQGVSDNFDCSISSPNGLKQTHSMAIIMTQEKTSAVKAEKGLASIRRKTKKELQSVVFPQPAIHRYKGPANPPMPQNEAISNVRPLKMLASAALSVARANDADFHFMNLIANDVTLPEYNGYNTRITRESGQNLKPATHVTYFPLINMNTAKADTILTTIHLVKSDTEKA